jgi:hypothetical protein
MKSDQSYNSSKNIMQATAFGMMAGLVGGMLLNKNNRDRFFSAMDKMFQMSDERVHEMTEKAKNIKEKGRRKLIAGLEKAQTKLEHEENDEMSQ